MKESGFCEKEQGSYTIEAVLIMSAVFLTLFLLCFSFMLMYHRVLLTKAATEIAETAANDWTKETSPYYRIFELNSGGKTVEKTVTGSFDEEKLQQVFQDGTDDRKKTADAVSKKLNTVLKNTFPQLLRCIKEPAKTTVKVTYENGFIIRKIKVEITQEIKIPFGQLKQFFDGKAEAVLQAQSTAVVTDPADMIRNVDLALEYASKVKEKIDLDKLLGKVKKAAPQE